MKPRNELSQELSGEVRDLLDRTTPTTPETHECFPRRTDEEEEAALAQIAASQQQEREEEGAILKALRLLVEELKETGQFQAPEEAASGRAATAVHTLAVAMGVLDDLDTVDIMDMADDDPMYVAGQIIHLRSTIAQVLNILCGADVRCTICGNPIDKTDPADAPCDYCIQAGLALEAREQEDNQGKDGKDPDKGDHSDAPRGMN